MNYPLLMTSFSVPRARRTYPQAQWFRWPPQSKF